MFSGEQEQKEKKEAAIDDTMNRIERRLGKIVAESIEVETKSQNAPKLPPE